MAPSAAEVLTGTATVALACICGAYAARAALVGRNLLWLICVAGTLLVVAGVVGQRTYPSSDAAGKDPAAHQLPGPWEAGVGIPVIGVHVTPVTLVGLLLTVAGTSLVLFFEAAPGPPEAAAGRLSRLEEDDTV